MSSRRRRTIESWRGAMAFRMPRASPMRSINSSARFPHSADWRKVSAMRSRIAVLASGGGSNLQAILEHFDWLGDRRGGDVVLVASDRSDAGALERASRHGIIGTVHATPKHTDAPKLSELLNQH